VGVITLTRLSSSLDSSQRISGMLLLLSLEKPAFSSELFSEEQDPVKKRDFPSAFKPENAKRNKVVRISPLFISNIYN